MAIRRFESNGRFSRVVEHNGILYISGQVCSNPNGDIKAQTVQTQLATSRHRQLKLWQKLKKSC